MKHLFNPLKQITLSTVANFYVISVSTDSFLNVLALGREDIRKVEV